MHLVVTKNNNSQNEGNIIPKGKIQSVDKFTMDFWNMSGCELANAVESIGYKNIALVANIDELLKQIDTDTLVDCLCNDYDRDLAEVIRGIFSSYVSDVQEGDKELSLNNAMLSLLKITTQKE